MVVCKFFLQGTCKFGQNCKFEHQINDSSQLHGTSILRQQGNASNIDTNTLVKSVQNDMLNAEKGGQWLLSSYAPFKDKPAFPGFEDKSFEEIRLAFYEASKSGTFDQCKQQVQMMLQDAASKIKALQNPSPEAIHMLTQIYNTPVNTGNNPLGQIFHTGNNSVFGQTQPSTQPIFGNLNQKSNSIFGGGGNSTSGSSNIFGKTQNIFGASQSTPSQNIFGVQQGTNSVFRNPQQSSLFTSNSPFNAPTNNSPFGVQPSNNSTFVNQANNSLFGPQTNNSPFGVQQPRNSPFGNQQTSNNIFNTQTGVGTLPFGPPHTQPFGQQTAQINVNQNVTPFGTQAPINTPFANQNQTSPFGLQQQKNSIFSTAQDTSQSKQQSNSVFSFTQLNSGSNIFAQSNSTNTVIPNNTSSVSTVGKDESAYSKLEDLTEAEIKSFESDHFEFGSIPDKPPTLQMCL